MEYRELLNEFNTYVENSDEYTANDLTDILHEIRTRFTKYDRTRNEGYLEQIEELLQRYRNIANIITNVERNTSAIIPDYGTLFGYHDEEGIPEDVKGVMGESVLEKLHRESGLRDKNNYLHVLFVETFGAWMDERDIVADIRQYSLKFAKGVILDLYGYQYGVYRKSDDEDDDDYRQRIIQHINERFTTPIVKSNNVMFFTCVSNPLTQLTSKNTYLTNDYLCYAPDDIEAYYNDNYITWRDIIWL